MGIFKVCVYLGRTRDICFVVGAITTSSVTCVVLGKEITRRIQGRFFIFR